MLDLSYHENLRRGTRAFPLAFYRVDRTHARYHMPLHWHMEDELVLVERGKLILRLNSRAAVLTEGSAALIRGGVLHAGEPEDCVYNCLVFDGSALFERTAESDAQASQLLRQEWEIPAPFPSQSRTEAAARAVFREEACRGNGREFLVTGALWRFWGMILEEGLYLKPVRAGQKAQRQVSLVKAALDLIRREYAAPLSLERLAAEAQLSPRYFCRVFHAIVGKPPVDYLRSYRLECAAERLLATNESITEIALSCGFNDLSYFSRAFTGQMGLSPRSWRKRHL